MGSLRGRHFNPRYAQNIAVPRDFNSASDFIVIGYRDADAQLACFLGNRLYRTVSVRIVGMKMKVYNSVFLF